MATAWIETSMDVYRAIYHAHQKDFSVFESYTSETEYVTAWGFKRADFPIIKSEKRGDKWRYFIALNELDF